MRHNTQLKQDHLPQIIEQLHRDNANANILTYERALGILEDLGYRDNGNDITVLFEADAVERMAAHIDDAIARKLPSDYIALLREMRDYADADWTEIDGMWHRKERQER